MKSVYDILRTPIITEKGAILQASQNKYIFQVATDANKIEVKKAVEEIYNVKVTKVNLMNIRGKLKRVRSAYGRTAAWKKAIVTLKAGNSIDLT
jgi:large subunit ribosomal protein L23